MYVYGTFNVSTRNGPSVIGTSSKSNERLQSLMTSANLRFIFSHSDNDKFCTRYSPLPRKTIHKTIRDIVRDTEITACAFKIG